MTVDALRAMGHDVMDIRGSEKEGLSDFGIWEIIQKEKRLIITTDKGFSTHSTKYMALRGRVDFCVLVKIK